MKVHSEAAPTSRVESFTTSTPLTSANQAIRISLEVLGDDRGNVESALTLIPLMLLFLVVAQMAIGVFARTTVDQETQGKIAYNAMGSTSGVSSLSQPPISLPLPGGGSVLVGERSVHLSGVTPLVPLGETFISRGIAVQE